MNQNTLSQAQGKDESNNSIPKRVSYNEQQAVHQKPSLKNAEFDEIAIVNLVPRDTKKNSSKKVMFDKKVIIFPIRQIASKMTLTEKNELYYTEDDTNSFKMEVNQVRIALANRARHLALTVDPNITAAQHVAAMVASNPDLHCLGRHLCPIQIKNKMNVMTITRKYQRHLLNSLLPLQKKDECFAEAYSKLSHWSKMKALEAARIVFMQAYDHQDGTQASTETAANSDKTDTKKTSETLPGSLRAGFTQTNDQAAVEVFIKDRLLAAVSIHASRTTSNVAGNTQHRNLESNPFEMTRKRKRSDLF